MVAISRAQIEDVSRLELVDPSLKHESFRRNSLTFSLTLGSVWVAKKGTEAVGFIQLHRHFFGQWFIELLFVREDSRRQGIGGSLLKKVIGEFHEKKLFTSTNESNEPMRRLLVATGFVPSGCIDNLDDGDPELVYLYSPVAA